MRTHRYAGWALTAALAFLATPAICSASPSSDAINTVRLAINALNRGNMSSYVALCDSPAFVIDTFDPYKPAVLDWPRHRPCSSHPPSPSTPLGPPTAYTSPSTSGSSRPLRTPP